MANALHIDSTGSSKRVLTTNQSTISIQKNGNVQIVGMYCTNVLANQTLHSAFSCPKTSTIDDVNILWRTQRRLKFESGSKRVKEPSVTAHCEHAHDEWSIRDLLYWQNYPYPSPFLVSSPVAFKLLNVLVLNIAEKLLAGR